MSRIVKYRFRLLKQPFSTRFTSKTLPKWTVFFASHIAAQAPPAAISTALLYMRAQICCVCCMWRSYMCGANICVWELHVHTGIQFRQGSSIAGASGARFSSPSPTYLPLYLFQYLTKPKILILICGETFCTGLSCSANFWRWNISKESKSLV